VPAGHAIGRLGCFLAGCCYGSHCELPWAVTYTDPLAAARAGTPLNEPLHPVQLYEMGSELALAGFLSWWLLRKSRFTGQVSCFYLIGYAVLRFLYEFLRTDHRGTVGPVSTSQAIALAVVAVATPLLVLGWRRARTAG
jgi:phosphatidylglycerol:prolipoprotein diacylglycerol transferase